MRRDGTVFCKNQLQKIRQIPKRAVAVWIILGLCFIYCLIQIFLPPLRVLDDVHELEFFVDNIYLRDSHDTKGRRMKLELVSDGVTFYLWYPQSSYAKFSNKV